MTESERGILRQLSRLGALESPFKEDYKFSPGPVAASELPPDAAAQTLEELQAPQVDLYPPREYFILTHAGKPVFARYVPFLSGQNVTQLFPAAYPYHRRSPDLLSQLRLQHQRPLPHPHRLPQATSLSTHGHPLRPFRQLLLPLYFLTFQAAAPQHLSRGRSFCHLPLHHHRLRLRLARLLHGIASSLP